MSKTNKIRVNFLDRATRLTLGAMMLMTAFALPLPSDWFAGLTAASSYPLLTGTVAWDPFYALIEFVRQRFIDYHIFH